MWPVLIKIGNFKIYSYGVLAFLGVWTSYILVKNLAKKENLDLKIIESLFIWSLFLGLLGGRILFILINLKNFLNSPLSYIFSRAGFAFQGGVILGIFSLYIMCKRKKINFLRVSDIFSLGLVLGHSIGRIGCFLNGCCYGKPSEKFGILFKPDSPAGALGVKVIPTQLISSFFLFIIFLILLRIYKRRRFLGEVFSFYFLLYGTFRFLIEFLRGDPRPFLGMFSIFQYISMIFVGVGILNLIFLRKLFKMKRI